MVVFDTIKLKKHGYLKNLLDRDNNFINTKYIRLSIDGGIFKMIINTTVFQLESDLTNAINSVDETFDVGVDGNLFFTSISTIKGDVTTLRVKDNTLLISDNDTRIRLSIIRGEEIDNVDRKTEDTTPYTYFTVGDITKLLPFTTTDNSGFSGVTLDASKTGVLSFFATNRHHIGYIERILGDGVTSPLPSAIFPKEVISSLGKLGADVKVGIAENEGGAITIKYDEDGMNGRIYTRLLNFPTTSLGGVFAKVPTRRFNIDRTELKETIDTLKTLTDDTTASLTVKQSSDGLIMVLNHPDFNKRMKIAGELDADFEVSIDTDGLLLGLSVFGDKYVDLFADETAPFIMFSNGINKTIHAKKRRF